MILETVREIQTPYQFSFCRMKASLGFVLGFRGEVQIKELFRYPQYHYLSQTHRDSKSEQRPSNHCRHPRFYFANQTLGLTRGFRINFYNVLHCPYPNGWFANGIELTYHSPFVDGWITALPIEEALEKS